MKHIYLHVPFCRRRCSYCDFSIAVRRAIPAARYLAAIKRERDLLFASGEWDDERLETLYFGGGTPSLLPPEAVAELVEFFMQGDRGRSTPPDAPARRSTPMGAGSPSIARGRERGGASPLIARRGGAGGGSPLIARGGGTSGASPSIARGRSGVVEVTLEANPDDVTPRAAAAWRAAGINRVSLGVQSFSPAVLRWMHRTHTAGRAARAVRALRGAGFDNLSLDLIFALPGALRPDFRPDLEQALELEPEHLSIYGLSVEPRTPLARWISAGAVTPSADQRYANEFLLAHELLTGAGFEHYEVSNYAKPGKRSRHNSAYWSGEPYAGLGPSAHGYTGTVRRWNIAPWAAYERVVHQGHSPEEGREVLSKEERALERIYLGLRTRAGVEVSLLGRGAAPLVADAVEAGLLRRCGRRIEATPRGWLSLDGLVSRLSACHVA